MMAHNVDPVPVRSVMFGAANIREVWTLYAETNLE